MRESKRKPAAVRRLLAAAALAVGVLAGWQWRSLAADAAEDVEALARAQVERFYVANSGRAPLADLLGEAFQLIRPDGTRFDRATYLANPPSLQGYSLDDFRAARTGDLLTATFFASARVTMDGVTRDVAGQPRLAVFSRQGDDWKLQAFANLGQGTPADIEAEGRRAVDAWLGAVVSGDRERISAVLAPEMQLARSDGAGYDKAAYLDSDLPKITAMPLVEGLVVTGFANHLVARYTLTLEGTIGGKPVETRAPRLTVFRRGDGAWLVVAHANFAQIGQ